MAKKPQEGRVKLLACILGRENEVALTEICNEFCVSLHFSTLCFGTAKSNYMTYLGLDEIEKRLVYALMVCSAMKCTLTPTLRALSSSMN